jgi:hypothetical protein
MRLKDIPRKFLAVVALFALLATSTPALAESLSASDLLACCKTAYCPVHHRQVRDMETDKSNCDAQGKSAGSGCSMRACDPAPDQAVGTASFTLAAPITISFEPTVQDAPLSLSAFVPYVVSLPSTPPPRTPPS